MGLALCAMLRTKGRTVLGLGRSATHKAALEAMGVEYIQASINQPLVPLFAGYRLGAIVHCAALSSPWGPYSAFYQTNVLGTTHALDLARRQHSAFVHISSPSLYCDLSDRLDIAEDAPLPQQFASHYTTTKALAEHLVNEAGNQGLSTVILRPRGIFGPHDTGLLPRVLRLARRGFFPLPRGGEALVDVTHVSNVAHAICLCLAHMDNVQGQTLNITNGQSLRVHELLSMLFLRLGLRVRLVHTPLSLLTALALMGEAASRACCYAFEPPITRYTLGLLACSQTLNIDKARNLLGYQPLCSIEEGLGQLVLPHE